METREIRGAHHHGPDHRGEERVGDANQTGPTGPARGAEGGENTHVQRTTSQVNSRFHIKSNQQSLALYVEFYLQYNNTIY